VSKVVWCGRRNTFATFPEDALQFSWQAQHFGRVHRHFARQAQHFRRVVLPYRSGKVIWSKIGNSKKVTFLKIILVDFFFY